MLTDFSYQCFQRADTRLAVFRRSGLGMPMLFLHGLAGSSDEWDRLVTHLDIKNPITALDLRGHGLSERHPTDLSAKEFVTDCEFVIQKLGVEKVIVVGQSMGGIIATYLAHQLPDRISALILIDAGMSGFDTEHDFSQLEEWLNSQDVDTDVMLQSLKSLGATDRWAEWKELVLPTLVCLAERSILSVEERNAMQQIRPKCEYRVVADSGHDIHLDAPEALAQLLKTFVDEKFT